MDCGICNQEMRQVVADNIVATYHDDDVAGFWGAGIVVDICDRDGVWLVGASNVDEVAVGYGPPATWGLGDIDD